VLGLLVRGEEVEGFFEVFVEDVDGAFDVGDGSGESSGGDFIIESVCLIEESGVVAGCEGEVVVRENEVGRACSVVVEIGGEEVTESYSLGVTGEEEKHLKFIAGGGVVIVFGVVGCWCGEVSPYLYPIGNSLVAGSHLSS